VIPRVLPSTGHWAPYEQPEAFNAVLAEFLRKASRGIVR